MSVASRHRWHSSGNIVEQWAHQRSYSVPGWLVLGWVIHTTCIIHNASYYYDVFQCTPYSTLILYGGLISQLMLCTVYVLGCGGSDDAVSQITARFICSEVK